MERGSVYEVFEEAAHPYTQALLECLPGRGRELGSISGRIPDLHNAPDGCRFANRCDHAKPECHESDQPPVYDIPGSEQAASCIYYGPDGDPSVVRDGSGTADAPERGRTDGGEPR
jgi:peptide/nickel transport system ATP-binding protein